MVDEKTGKLLRKAIGEEICHLRLNASMTQTALGEAIGVTQHQVQRYESGEGALSVDRLAAIASALKVHPGHFFGRLQRAAEFTASPMFVRGPTFKSATDEDLQLAERIARIRCDEERLDILQSIEQTVDLLLHNQQR